MFGIDRTQRLSHRLSTGVLNRTAMSVSECVEETSSVYSQQSMTLRQDLVLIVACFATVQDHALRLVCENEKNIFRHVLITNQSKSVSTQRTRSASLPTGRRKHLRMDICP
jgi:hypothetical protein